MLSHLKNNNSATAANFFLFKEDRDGENGRDGFEQQTADNMLNCPSHNLTRRHGPFPLILPLKCRILYGEHVTAVVKAQRRFSSSQVYTELHIFQSQTFESCHINLPVTPTPVPEQVSMQDQL